MTKPRAVCFIFIYLKFFMIYLTQPIRFFIEQSIVFHLLKNLPLFHQTRNFIIFFYKITMSRPQLRESCPYSYILFLKKHLTIFRYKLNS